MFLKQCFLVLCICFLAGCMDTRSSINAENAEKRIRTAKVNIQLGLAYLERHNIQISKQKFLKAISLAPNLPESWYAMGFFLEATGEKTQAQKYYLKAIKLAPERGDSQNNYGTFLCRAGDYYGAIQHFIVATRDPNYLDSAGAYENAGLCSLKIPNKKLAERYFKEAIKQDANRPVSLFSLATLYYQRGQFKYAKTKMDQYLTISPATQQSLALNESIQRRLHPIKSDNYLLGEKFIQTEKVKNILAVKTKTKAVEVFALKPKAKLIETSVLKSKTKLVETSVLKPKAKPVEILALKPKAKPVEMSALKSKAKPVKMFVLKPTKKWIEVSRSSPKKVSKQEQLVRVTQAKTKIRLAHQPTAKQQKTMQKSHTAVIAQAKVKKPATRAKAIT